MEPLVIYLIRSLLVSGLMLGYYALVLRNGRSHAFNRVWLLMTMLASVVLPLVRVGWLTWHSAQVQRAVVLGAGSHPAGTAVFPALTLVLGIDGAVGLVLLAILGFRIASVYRTKWRYPRKSMEGCCVIEVPDRRAPFSFLSNLFWQKGADISDPVQRKIFDHELAHIRGGHSYDMLFAQILTSVYWMNPFFWLIRRELQMVHEFIADGASVGVGDTETFARMLLLAYDGGRYFDPSHHFFHSPIKRRLRMISSSKPPSRLWKALALPILLGVVVLACSKEQSAPAAQQTKPFSLKLKEGLKLQLDSAVQLKLSSQIKQVFLVAMTKKDGHSHVDLDTLGIKANLDLVQVEGQAGKSEKVPPPPPPQPNK